MDETDLTRDFAGRLEDNVGVLFGIKGRVVVRDAHWDLGLSDEAKKCREHSFFDACVKRASEICFISESELLYVDEWIVRTKKKMKRQTPAPLLYGSVQLWLHHAQNFP